MTGRRPLTIAVIDDDRYFREAIKDLLEAAGYIAVVYGSADEFLQREGYRNAACILADIIMPGTSGLEMLRWLQGVEGCPPVVVITSCADQRLKVAALEGGALIVLRKPVESEAVFASIGSAVG